MTNLPRAAALLLALVLPLALPACSGARPIPKGPPPEYEEPAAPSWVDGGSATPPACDAGQGC